MNKRTPVAALLAFLVLGMAGGTALAACKLTNAELPVTINGLSARINAKVNGTDETFIIDSGANFGVITDQKAAELKLPLGPPLPNVQFSGIGGAVDYHIATVKELTIAGSTRRRVEFVTEGTDLGGVAGLIGENFLRAAGDVEYDFANGVLRLFHPQGCGHSLLAYWVKPDQAYGVIDINSVPGDMLIKGSAYVNGARINVVFDTGAAQSVLSLRAAARAGIKPGDPGVESAGTFMGMGQRTRETWIARFASFKIGDEEIQNARLRIGDIPDVDMLLGFDFFLSHRIYVANSQNKLYLTYNGGPVFNLTAQPRPAAPTASAGAHGAPGAPATASAQPGPPPAPGGGGAPVAASTGKDQAGTAGAEPADAAGYARRAAIHLLHHDYEHAIADMTRAIELDPSQPQFFHERANAYLGRRQMQLARADLDHLLTLKPNDAPALLQRAELRLATHEQPAALTDLEAASRAAPKEDGIRFDIGQIYQGIGMLRPAIEQYDLWLASHEEDPRFSTGLLMRCRVRALEGQELEKALSDCNATLRRVSGTASVQALETRGLVRLRRGELDKSIQDYGAALKLAPRDAWALYGRGLARLRKGAAADGEADLAAARAQAPRVEEEFRKMGLTP